MTELIPCPFCANSQARVVTCYLDYLGTLCGYCEVCGSYGPTVPVDLKHIDECKQRAAELWNSRQWTPREV